MNVTKPGVANPAPAPARTTLIATSTLGATATPIDPRAAVVPAHTTTSGSKDALVAEALRVRLADWQAVWDQHIVAAGNDMARLLAVFDALASYRCDQNHPSRWCAFLAAATELPAAADEISAVLAADIALLATRLLHFSRPLAGARAQDLADEVLLAYSGTLPAFLRGSPHSPIDVGRRLAHSAAQAHSRH